MRITLIAGAAVLLVCSAACSVALSDTACRNQTSALGTSRIVEVDTSGGPRLGHQQYRDIDLLQEGEVALTFDDGPLRPYTQPVLEALAAHCTKATFFVVGRMALSDPEMVKEIARRGHTIGTHTWSHQNLRALLSHRAKDEIELGFSAVRKAVGGPIAPFFRFPYLNDSRGTIAYLQRRQIAIFSIDADAYDYRTQDAETVHLAIIQQLMEKRKGIILFHDIQPSTARALKKVLDDLQARGFRVVHFVPKAPATTLQEYDALAGKVLASNHVAAANPVALRPALWPLAASGTKTGPARPLRNLSPPPQPARGNVGRVEANPRVTTRGEADTQHARRAGNCWISLLCSTTTTATTAPARAEPPRPQQRRAAAERWQDRVFGY